MPGLVASVLANPFRRLPRYEYTYGPSSQEALDPIAPLLDDTVYDNTGVIIVADTYSVWPETGIFPKATSYREVLDGLRGYMRRKCSIRLSPRLCRRVEYIVSPWTQLVGGWVFRASPSDAEAFAIHGLLEAMQGLKGRIDRIVVVLDPDADTGLSYVAIGTARYISALAGARLVIAAVEPRPYPVARRKELGLEDIDAEDYDALVRIVLAEHTTRENLSRPLLEPRTPLGAQRYRVREEDASRITIVSALAAKERHYALLAYQACGSRDPLKKLEEILGKALSAYIEATQLVKKPIGGQVVHHLYFNHDKLRALAQGVLAEALALQIVKKHQDCSTLYRKGVSRAAIEELEEMLGGRDKTPAEHIEEGKDYIRVKNLNKLRNRILAAP